MSIDDILGKLIVELLWYYRCTDFEKSEQCKKKIAEELKRYEDAVTRSNFCFRCDNYVEVDEGRTYLCVAEVCAFKDMAHTENV